MISDGADTASDRTLQQAREAVVRRDAFVYAIAIDEAGAQASTRVNPEALREITGRPAATPRSCAPRPISARPPRASPTS